MKTLVLGFLLFAAVIAIATGNLNAAVYLQWHSLLLVCGGTFAILLLSTSPGVLASVVKTSAELRDDDENFEDYRQDLTVLSQNRKKPPASENELIQYASDLWASGVEADLFIVLLSQKRKEVDSKSLDAVQAMKNLSKYPPALGMIGTVIGMISLFSNLDANKANIGSSLSLAMTATFFGLLLTNGLISPMADRMHVKQMNHQRTLDAIYEILLLINRGEPTALITEEIDERAS
jgi:chemotaxis protein MotA